MNHSEKQQEEVKGRGELEVAEEQKVQHESREFKSEFNGELMSQFLSILMS